MDPQQELWISGIKTLDPIEKTVELGKIAMPDNEIHFSCIKTLDPKYKVYFA